MFCKKCGAELPEEAKFCVKCGTSLESDAKPISQKDKSFHTLIKGIAIGCAVAGIVGVIIFSVFEKPAKIVHESNSAIME